MLLLGRVPVARAQALARAPAQLDRHADVVVAPDGREGQVPRAAAEAGSLAGTPSAVPLERRPRRSAASVAPGCGAQRGRGRRRGASGEAGVLAVPVAAAGGEIEDAVAAERRGSQPCRSR